MYKNRNVSRKRISSNKDFNKNLEFKEKIRKVRSYCINKKFSLAFEILKSLEDEYYDNPFFILEFGVYYFENENYDKALEYFKRLLTEKNKYYALYYIGKIQIIKKDFSKATDSFDAIINSDHEDKSFAKLERAKIYKCEKDYDSAFNLLNEIEQSINRFDKNEFYTAVILEKADVLSCQKKYDEAQKVVKNEIKNIKSRNLINKAIYILADIEYERENYDECQKYIDRIDSNYKVGQMLKAKLSYQKKQYEESRKISSKLLNDTTYSIEANIWYAKSGIALGLLDESQIILENIVKNNDNFCNLNYELGIIYFNRLDYKNAIEKFNFCIDNNFDNKDYAKSQLIYVYMKLGNITEAFNYYKELDKIDFFSNDYYRKCLLSLYFSKYIENYTPIIHNFYMYKQLKEYRLNSTLEHISKHQDYDSEEKCSLFSPDINLLELIEYTKRHINESNFVNNNFCDVYVLDYPKVGIENNHYINKYKVVTLPNTTDIVTMFPLNSNVYKNQDEPEVINKNYIKVSQIDRFKKRYGMN